ncbi:hypothetical protein LTR78_006733 [Recurvomyces mirabilis]|uniref:Uncharacterized protein n=1 Tax=Recurvomyces mirabilis TaxID=574656 RepID=A0AAE0WKP9_9PEZI|nr:hypothetical protein LTR78_006733 [Recurvomyces mirabilis]KAK5151378.1 hypothetical protein LTS14_009221 [Recurvomyces mirabilis]
MVPVPVSPTKRGKFKVKTRPTRPRIQTTFPATQLETPFQITPLPSSSEHARPAMDVVAIDPAYSDVSSIEDETDLAADSSAEEPTQQRADSPVLAKQLGEKASSLDTATTQSTYNRTFLEHCIEHDLGSLNIANRSDGDAYERQTVIKDHIRPNVHPENTDEQRIGTSVLCNESDENDSGTPVADGRLSRSGTRSASTTTQSPHSPIHTIMAAMARMPGEPDPQPFLFGLGPLQMLRLQFSQLPSCHSNMRADPFPPEAPVSEMPPRAFQLDGAAEHERGMSQGIMQHLLEAYHATAQSPSDRSKASSYIDVIRRSRLTASEEVRQAQLQKAKDEGLLGLYAQLLAFDTEDEGKRRIALEQVERHRKARGNTWPKTLDRDRTPTPNSRRVRSAEISTPPSGLTSIPDEADDHGLSVPMPGNMSQAEGRSRANSSASSFYEEGSYGNGITLEQSYDDFVLDEERTRAEQARQSATDHKAALKLARQMELELERAREGQAGRRSHGLSTSEASSSKVDESRQDALPPASDASFHTERSESGDPGPSERKSTKRSSRLKPATRTIKGGPKFLKEVERHLSSRSDHYETFVDITNA